MGVFNKQVFGIRISVCICWELEDKNILCPLHLEGQWVLFSKSAEMKLSPTQSRLQEYKLIRVCSPGCRKEFERSRLIWIDDFMSSWQAVPRMNIP